MELTKQVVSLDLAKRLKELGVKQESLFYWTRYPFGHGEYVCWFAEKLSTTKGETADWEQISAFTVAELGEMLPDTTYTHKSTKYGWWYTEWPKSAGRFAERTEADARAKMLIYLLENKLLAANN